MEPETPMPETPMPEAPMPESPTSGDPATEEALRRRLALLTGAGAMPDLIDGPLRDLPDDTLIKRMRRLQIAVTHATAMDCLRRTADRAAEPHWRADELRGATRLLTLCARQMDQHERRHALAQKPAKEGPKKDGATRAGAARDGAARGGVGPAPGEPPGVDPDDPKTWTGPIQVIWETGPAPVPSWLRRGDAALANAAQADTARGEPRPGGPVTDDRFAGDPVTGDALRRQDP